MELVNIQPIVDIIALTLQSTFISNESNGVSLLLISKPETAKTSAIFKFHNLDFASYYDEITQKKIIDEFLPLVKAEQKSVLLIPDLINCIEKQKTTREQFLNMIKSGIDDTGIVQISTYHKQLSYLKLVEGLKFSVITAITSENFHKVERYLKETGLLSRFIPFSYDYPINLVKTIFEIIEGSSSSSNKISIPKIIKSHKKIENEPELFKNFEMVSMKLGMQYKAYGIRGQTNLQRLAKANALLNSRTKVNKEDIDKILYLSNWINYDYNSIIK